MQWAQKVRRGLYRGRRPGALARFLNGIQARLAAYGVGPARLVTLEVRGRNTGRRIVLPVVVADYGGQRYLVSMLGNDANWVRNVRAAGGHAILRHRSREHIELEEIPAAERAPILRRYLELAPGARPHMPIDQTSPPAAIENVAQDYPVFRIKVDTDPGHPA